MTALPVRCRNTNDALRKPFSAAGRASAVPAPNAPAWVEPCAPSACPGRDPDCRRGSCGGPGRRPGRGRLRRTASAAQRALRAGRRRRGTRQSAGGPGLSGCPVAACGTSTTRRRCQRRCRCAGRRRLDPRQRSGRQRGRGGMRTVTSRGSTTRGAAGAAAQADPPPAAACSAVAGRCPERAWGFRPRPSYPTDPARGARCPADGIMPMLRAASASAGAAWASST